MNDIKGYEGLYAITKDGKVWSYPKYRHKGKFLIPYLRKDGYLSVGLFKDKKPKRMSVHRLVALAYIENHENKPEINHLDGNKSNNKVDNLEWVTSSENQIHAIKNGLQRFTEKHRLAAIETGRKNGLKGKGKQKKKKIPNELGVIISARHKNGESLSSLGREFKVDKMTIKSTIKRIDDATNDNSNR
jgi:hypothetical protein